MKKLGPGRGPGRQRPWWLCWLLAGGLVLVMAGCGKHDAGPGATAPPKNKLKRNVELAQVKQDKVEVFVDTVGYLDAEGQTEIAAGVTGIVEEVYFREGDWVTEDTVLCRVEPLRYEAMMAQARAQQAKAHANVEKARANLKKAQANLRDADESLNLKQVVLENMRRAGRSVATEVRQEAEASVEVNKARREVCRAEVEVCKAEIVAATKEADATGALVDLAANNLKRSYVRAPYSGQINQRKVTRGSYLEERSVVAVMADLRQLRLVGYIPEKSAPMVRQMVQQEQRLRAAFLTGSILATPIAGLAALVGDSAGDGPSVFQLEFTLRPLPDQTFRGRIFYLSSVASPDTHMFECKAEVPFQGLHSELRPGYTAKIRCPLPSNPRAVILPEEAVRASERGDIVFRPRAVTRPDGEVEWVAESIPVELGARTPGSVEVRKTLAKSSADPKKGAHVEVLRGLKVGDWIVRKGAESLEDNTPLNIHKDQLPLLTVSR